MSLYDKDLMEEIQIREKKAWKDFAHKVGAAQAAIRGEANVWTLKQCECGSEKCGSPKHSHYCPKYIKDDIA
jgi:hypothetical protein